MVTYNNLPIFKGEGTSEIWEICVRRKGRIAIKRISMGLSCSLSVKGIKVNVMNILKKLGIGWRKFSFDCTQQTCWLLMYWAIHITKTTKAGKVFTISQFCDLYSYHVRKALLPFQIFLFTNFLPQKQSHRHKKRLNFSLNMLLYIQLQAVSKFIW